MGPWFFGTTSTAPSPAPTHSATPRSPGPSSTIYCSAGGAWHRCWCGIRSRCGETTQPEKRCASRSHRLSTTHSGGAPTMAEGSTRRAGRDRRRHLLPRITAGPVSERWIHAALTWCTVAAWSSSKVCSGSAGDGPEAGPDRGRSAVGHRPMPQPPVAPWYQRPVLGPATAPCVASRRSRSWHAV